MLFAFPKDPKLRKEVLKRLGIALLLGAASVGVWLFELFKVIGWAGLNWLRQDPFSIYVFGFSLSLSMALCADVPGNETRRPRWLTFGLYVALMFIISMNCFHMARQGVAYINSLWAFVYLEPSALFKYGGLFLAPLSICIFSVVGSALLKFFFRLGFARTALLLVLALVLVAPLSLVTVLILPAWDGSRDFVHAVKMGYPAFWTVALCAVAVVLGRSTSRKVNPG